MKPILLIVLWLACWLGLPGAARAQSEATASGFGAPRSVPEYTMKAHYLLQLMQYTQWPSEAVAAGMPMQLCILGSAPFDRADLQKRRFETHHGAHGIFLVRRRIAAVKRVARPHQIEMRALTEINAG